MNHAGAPRTRLSCGEPTPTKAILVSVAGLTAVNRDGW
jgi:hypothetical protein